MRDIFRADQIAIGDVRDDPDVEHPDLVNEDPRNIARNAANVQNIPEPTWTEGRTTPSLVNVPLFDNFLSDPEKVSDPDCCLFIYKQS
jgi:hypothetical protein